jgi:type II secretory pathway predicted ATPase ExeA
VPSPLNVMDPSSQPDQLEELRAADERQNGFRSPVRGDPGRAADPEPAAHGHVRRLDQRIATRFTIKPMDLTESAAYLRRHLALAGREEPLFADHAIALLHRFASELPVR